MAEHLASIFGTEKDRVNCPFYFKMGACRHGDRCARLHTKPTISPTLLFSNIYQRPDILTPGVDASAQNSNLDPRKVQDHFEYNLLNSQPDVLTSLYSPLQQNSPLEGVRYYDGGQLSDQQMALLQYQRENLHFLNEEVLWLRECLSKYERTNDGSTPQKSCKVQGFSFRKEITFYSILTLIWQASHVDLAHLLAARDQELRTLSAEMDQLQSELRLARSLIAERDSELQSIRITNNNYGEENERLRAILGEWSAHAAELERAPEAERIRNPNPQKTIPSSSGQ